LARVSTGWPAGEIAISCSSLFQIVNGFEDRSANPSDGEKCRNPG
jgi:hypothetical protein